MPYSTNSESRTTPEALAASRIRTSASRDYNSYGTPNLPPYLDPYDAFAIFKLFFKNKILDKLIEWTNKYAELYPAKEDTRQLYPRAHLPTCKEYMKAYRKLNRLSRVAARPS